MTPSTPTTQSQVSSQNHTLISGQTSSSIPIGTGRTSNLKRWIDRTGAYNSGFSVLTPLPGTDLWDSGKDDVRTEDWELFDICHAVLPTRLPLPEFYREYAGLWHALDTRFKKEGQLRCYVGLLLALATRKVTFSAMRKGMRLGLDNILAKPESYHRAHESSAERLRAAEGILEPLAAVN